MTAGGKVISRSDANDNAIALLVPLRFPPPPELDSVERMTLHYLRPSPDAKSRRKRFLIKRLWNVCWTVLHPRQLGSRFSTGWIVRAAWHVLPALNADALHLPTSWRSRCGTGGELFLLVSAQGLVDAGPGPTEASRTQSRLSADILACR